MTEQNDLFWYFVVFVSGHTYFQKAVGLKEKITTYDNIMNLKQIIERSDKKNNVVILNYILLEGIGSQTHADILLKYDNE